MIFMMKVQGVDCMLVLSALSVWFMHSAGASSCQFPDFLQTSDEPYQDRWSTNQTNAGVITNDAGQHYIKVYGGLISASALRGWQGWRYNRTCLTAIGQDTFLVSNSIKHPDDTRETNYLCMKFIKRSRYVVSIHASDVSVEQDEGLCSDLKVDVRPWVWMGKHEHIDCPVIGGFNFQLYDHEGKERCHEYYNVPRIEFGCSASGYVDLGFKRCRVRNLVYAVDDDEAWIRTYCMGSWTEGDYRFVILRKMNVFSVWSLRLPANPGDSFDAHIMSDIACETNDVITESNQYAKMHLTRKVVTSSCSDSSEDCYMDSSDYTCDNSYDNNLGIQACRNVCSDCTPGSKTECDFGEFNGSWTPLTGPFDSLILGNGAADLTPRGKHYCEPLRTIQNQREMHMVVHYQDNGCFPRTYCFYHEKTNPSLMFYKFAEGPIWPFYPRFYALCEMSSSNRNVRDFPFSVLNPTPAVIQGEVQAQSCGIPEQGYRFDVTFIHDRHNKDDDEKCEGELTLPDCIGEQSTGFTLEYKNCDNPSNTGAFRFTCLGQSPEARHWSKLTVVKEETSGAYMCFNFYFRAGKIDGIKVLPIEECYEDGLYIGFTEEFDNLNAFVPDECQRKKRDDINPQIN